MSSTALKPSTVEAPSCSCDCVLVVTCDLLTRTVPQYHGYCLPKPSRLPLIHAEAFRPVISEGCLAFCHCPTSMCLGSHNTLALGLFICPSPSIIILLTRGTCLPPLRLHAPLNRLHILERSFAVAKPASHSTLIPGTFIPADNRLRCASHSACQLDCFTQLSGAVSQLLFKIRGT